MLNSEDLSKGLNQFYGTEEYHKWSCLFRHHVLTDGVKWLCDNANCYWLVDAVASHHSQCIKDPSLRDVQFWTLKVHSHNKATLTCERDENDVVITQKIPYTDFPLSEIKLWVQYSGEYWVILLPSEY